MPAYHPGKHPEYGPATKHSPVSGDHWFDERNRFTPRHSPEISTTGTPVRLEISGPYTTTVIGHGVLQQVAQSVSHFEDVSAFKKEQSNPQGGNRRETRPPSHLVPDTAVRLGAGATALASVVTGAATWLVLQKPAEASPASSPPNSVPHLTLSELQMKHFLGKTLQLGNSTSTPPPTETPFPMGEVFLVYRIGQGDTLKTIAERFNLTLKELLTIPGIENVVLRPGETISIPFELVNGKLTLDQSQSIQPDTTSREDTKTPTPVATQVAPVTEIAEATGLSYTIQGEDTLGDIAWKYQTSVQAILAENPDIEDKDHVPRGTVLKLPQDAKLRPAEPSETANTPVSATASSMTPETVVNTAAGEPQTSTQKPALRSSRARGTPPPPSVSSPSQDTPQVIPVPAPRPDKETVSGSEEQPSGTPPPEDILSAGKKTATTQDTTVEPSGKPPEIVTPSSQSPAVADADEQGNAIDSSVNSKDYADSLIQYVIDSEKIGKVNMPAFPENIDKLGEQPDWLNAPEDIVTSPSFEIIPKRIDLHWSEGNSVQDTYDVLKERGVACHFAVGQDRDSGDIVIYRMQALQPDKGTVAFTACAGGPAGEYTLYGEELKKILGGTPNEWATMIEPDGMDFDSKLPSKIQTQKTYELVAWLMKTYKIPVSGILGHLDTNIYKPDPGVLYLAGFKWQLYQALKDKEEFVSLLSDVPMDPRLIAGQERSKTAYNDAKEITTKVISQVKQLMSEDSYKGNTDLTQELEKAALLQIHAEAMIQKAEADYDAGGYGGYSGFAPAYYPAGIADQVFARDRMIGRALYAISKTNNKVLTREQMKILTKLITEGSSFADIESTIKGY